MIISVIETTTVEFSNDLIKFSTLHLSPFNSYALVVINPFTLMSDQDIISPYSISMISSSQVMRMLKNINKGIIIRFNSKFSEQT